MNFNYFYIFIVIYHLFFFYYFFVVNFNILPDCLDTLVTGLDCAILTVFIFNWIGFFVFNWLYFTATLICLKGFCSTVLSFWTTILTYFWTGLRTLLFVCFSLTLLVFLIVTAILFIIGFLTIFYCCCFGFSTFWTFCTSTFFSTFFGF
jgi:hypothetical protein